MSEVAKEPDTATNATTRPSASRRSVLRTLASTLSLGGGAVASSEPASAEHDTQVPSHVNDPVFEEQLLETYKPVLYTGHLDVKPTALHGFVVRSDQKDTTALTYWAEYPAQVSASGYISHIGDHEPYYVFLEWEGTRDEELDAVIYSGWHWNAAERSDPPRYNDTRPTAWVFADHHAYSHEVARQKSYPGNYGLPLKDLTKSLPQWLDNEDFHKALAEIKGGPAYNPWLMETRGYWWDEDALSWKDRAAYRMWLWLNIGNAERADL